MPEMKNKANLWAIEEGNIKFKWVGGKGHQQMAGRETVGQNENHLSRHPPHHRTPHICMPNDLGPILGSPSWKAREIQ